MVGATVVAMNVATGQTWETKTTETGRFVFKRLAAGKYVVAVSHQGYEPFESDEIELDGDGNKQDDVVDDSEIELDYEGVEAVDTTSPESKRPKIEGDVHSTTK